MVIMIEVARRLRSVLSLLALAPLVLATACGAAPTTGRSEGDRLNIVVAFYPYEFIAQRLAGPDATITNLTQVGAEPHDLELSPRQIGSLAGADLVLYQSGFQPAVDTAIEQASPTHLVDATTLVPTLDETDNGGHSADDGHGHGAGDPHLWLDPTNMATIAKGVAAKLGELRPDLKPHVDERAAELVDDLTTLDKRFSDGLATCTRTEFITSHAAFGYLAHRYDLHQISIAGLEPDTEPSASRVAEIHRLVEDHGVTTIFYETLVSPEVAKAIAADLGLKTDVLDPLEGLTSESRGSDYIAVMDANLRALETANGCS